MLHQEAMLVRKLITKSIFIVILARSTNAKTKLKRTPNNSAASEKIEDSANVTNFSYNYKWPSSQGYLVAPSYADSGSFGYTNYPNIQSLNQCMAKCHNINAPGGSYGHSINPLACYCDKVIECVEPVIVDRSGIVFSSVLKPRECALSYCDYFGEESYDYCNDPNVERRTLMPTNNPTGANEEASMGPSSLSSFVPSSARTLSPTINPTFDASSDRPSYLDTKLPVSNSPTFAPAVNPTFPTFQETTLLPTSEETPLQQTFGPTSKQSTDAQERNIELSSFDMKLILSIPSTNDTTITTKTNLELDRNEQRLLADSVKMHLLNWYQSNLVGMHNHIISINFDYSSQQAPNNNNRFLQRDERTLATLSQSFVDGYMVYTQEQGETANYSLGKMDLNELTLSAFVNSSQQQRQFLDLMLRQLLNDKRNKQHPRHHNRELNDGNLLQYVTGVEVTIPTDENDGDNNDVTFVQANNNKSSNSSDGNYSNAVTAASVVGAFAVVIIVGGIVLVTRKKMSIIKNKSDFDYMDSDDDDEDRDYMYEEDALHNGEHILECQKRDCNQSFGDNRAQVNMLDEEPLQAKQYTDTTSSFVDGSKIIPENTNDLTRELQVGNSSEISAEQEQYMFAESSHLRIFQTRIKERQFKCQSKNETKNAPQSRENHHFSGNDDRKKEANEGVVYPLTGNKQCRPFHNDAVAPQSKLQHERYDSNANNGNIFQSNDELSLEESMYMEKGIPALSNKQRQSPWDKQVVERFPTSLNVNDNVGDAAAVVDDELLMTQHTKSLKKNYVVVEDDSDSKSVTLSFNDGNHHTNIDRHLDKHTEEEITGLRHRHLSMSGSELRKLHRPLSYRNPPLAVTKPEINYISNNNVSMDSSCLFHTNEKCTTSQTQSMQDPNQHRDHFPPIGNIMESNQGSIYNQENRVEKEGGEGVFDVENGNSNSVPVGVVANTHESSFHDDISSNHYNQNAQNENAILNETYDSRGMDVNVIGEDKKIPFGKETTTTRVLMERQRNNRAEEADTFLTLSSISHDPNIIQEHSHHGSNFSHDVDDIQEDHNAMTPIRGNTVRQKVQFLNAVQRDRMVHEADDKKGGKG